MKILLVEDDEALSAILVQNLAAHHYVVDAVHDGESGWTYASTFDYDLIILDLMLPKLDGICLCQRLRSENDTTPILLLTSESASTAKVSALDAGADDYVVKPVDTQELVARIRALLRRSSNCPLPIMTWGALFLNPSTCEVTYDGLPLTLTTKEYELLELLLRTSPNLLSVEEILDRLWSSDDFPSEATVRSHIRRLRQKLVEIGAPQNFITTVHGRGYYLGTLQSEPRPAPTPEQDKQPNYLEFLNHLWSKTQPKALEQLEVINQAIAALQAGTCSQELQAEARQIAHKHVGTLGTFGLNQAMELARLLEQEFSSQTMLSSQQAERLEPLSIALQQTVQLTAKIQSVPGTPGQPNSAIVSIPLQSEPISRENPRVMIVDDDHAFLRMLPTLLQPWHFNITTLGEPQQFWAVLEAVQPDALVLDIHMPEINGLQLCQALRQQPAWRRLPILVLSSVTDLSTQNLAFTLGIDDYLCKPIVAIDLANRILNRLQRVQAWSQS